MATTVPKSTSRLLSFAHVDVLIGFHVLFLLNHLTVDAIYMPVRSLMQTSQANECQAEGKENSLLDTFPAVGGE